MEAITDTRIDKLNYQFLSAKIGSYPWPPAKAVNNHLIPQRGILAFEYTGRREADNPMVGIKNAEQVKTQPEPLTGDKRDAALTGMAEHLAVVGAPIARGTPARPAP